MRLGAIGFACSEDCRRQASVRRVATKSRGKRDDIPTLTRKIVHDRDGRRCRACRTTKLLELHHIRYRSSERGKPDRHAEWNLITLCAQHHAEVHSNKKKWQPILLAATWLHYVVGVKRASPETVRRFLNANEDPVAGALVLAPVANPVTE